MAVSRRRWRETQEAMVNYLNRGNSGSFTADSWANDWQAYQDFVSVAEQVGRAAPGTYDGPLAGWSGNVREAIERGAQYAMHFHFSQFRDDLTAISLDASFSREPTPSQCERYAEFHRRIRELGNYIADPALYDTSAPGSEGIVGAGAATYRQIMDWGLGKLAGSRDFLVNLSKQGFEARRVADDAQRRAGNAEKMATEIRDDVGEVVTEAIRDRGIRVEGGTGTAAADAYTSIDSIVEDLTEWARNHPDEARGLGLGSGALDDDAREEIVDEAMGEAVGAAEGAAERRLNALLTEDINDRTTYAGRLARAITDYLFEELGCNQGPNPDRTLPPGLANKPFGRLYRALTAERSADLQGLEGRMNTARGQLEQTLHEYIDQQVGASAGTGRGRGRGAGITEDRVREIIREAIDGLDITPSDTRRIVENSVETCLSRLMGPVQYHLEADAAGNRISVPTTHTVIDPVTGQGRTVYVRDENQGLIHQIGEDLENHGTRLDEAERVQGEHATSLTEYGDRLDEAERVQGEHATTLTDHGTRLDDVERVQDEHTTDLNEHGQLLNTLAGTPLPGGGREPGVVQRVAGTAQRAHSIARKALFWSGIAGAAAAILAGVGIPIASSKGTPRVVRVVEYKPTPIPASGPAFVNIDPDIQDLRSTLRCWGAQHEQRGSNHFLMYKCVVDGPPYDSYTDDQFTALETNPNARKYRIIRPVRDMDEAKRRADELRAIGNRGRLRLDLDDARRVPDSDFILGGRNSQGVMDVTAVGSLIDYVKPPQNLGGTR